MKIIITALALPFLVAASATFADTLKPTGFYLKGFYNTPIHSHYRTAPLYGAGVGYKFGLLRAEGTYGYSERSYGHTNSLNALGYLDLDNTTFLSPYIGLGLGTDYVHHAQHFNSNNTHGLGAIGTRAYLTQQLALDVGYVTHLNSNLSQGRALIGVAYQF